MKVAIHTLGCKVNTYESESVWEQFKADGYTRVSFKEYADIYIINTCTVTNNGDVKSRKAIRQAIKRNPEAVVAVMGCYAQMQPDDVYEIDGVDVVIGTTHRDRLKSLILEHLRKREQLREVIDVSRYSVFDEISVTNFTEHTRAFLKIQDGCNNFCTYCIIPYARGPVRSRPKDSIINEAKHLIENHYHEIVLTGIHTGGYGTDLTDYTFADLLRELATLDGLKRLRISSIEINELTEEVLHIIRDHDVFAKHLHIPIQSGSNRILELMRRKYTLQEFKDKIAYIKKLIPNIAITTDIIVGFPTETDDDSAEMKQTVKDIAFSELHIFPYSKRSGTKAARMKPQVNGIIKSMRVNELLHINEELASNYIAKQESLHVLFERSDKDFTYGHSSSYIQVKVEKDTTIENSILEVTLTKKKYGDTQGKVKG